VVTALRADGIEPGIVVDESTLLVCVTEATSAADIDRLAAAIAAALNTSDEQAACDAPSDDRTEESK